MNEAIASILKSAGWNDIVKIINAEFDIALLKTIATNQTDREIATQYIGITEGRKALQKAYKKIEKAAGEDNMQKPVSYK